MPRLPDFYLQSIRRSRHVSGPALTALCSRAAFDIALRVTAPRLAGADEDHPAFDERDLSVGGPDCELNGR